MLINPRAIRSTDSDLESCIDFANSSSLAIAVRVSARQTEVFISEYISGLPLMLFMSLLDMVKRLHSRLKQLSATCTLPCPDETATKIDNSRSPSRAPWENADSESDREPTEHNI